MKKTRVFIVVSTFHPILGGAERQALEQGRGLRQRGLEATIVTFRYNKSWAAHDTMDGVPIIRVAGLLLGSRDKLPRVLQKLLYFMALIVMAWKIWQSRHRYDVLHVYQLSLLALSAALACYLSGKPMVVAVRCADSGRKDRSQDQVSLIVGPLDAHRSMLRVSVEDRDEEGDLRNLERWGRPIVRFTRYLLQRLHAIIIILSTRMHDYLVNHDFAFNDVLLIPNGVDTSRFYPLSEDTPSNQRSQTVVCIARLYYQKGLDMLLQSWYLVHKELPEARLIVAGSGPLQAQLTYMAEALKLGESVEFLGTQTDVTAVLHRGSIAALPSRWEGMPNAILEAMACGLPCIATRVSGTEDIIKHEVNGLLVEPEDYQAMAQALLALLRDPARCSAYGKAARETIEQDYELEHITDLYLELYQRMISGNKIASQTQSFESQTSTDGVTETV